MNMDVKAVKAVQDTIDQRIRAASANSASTHMAEVVEVDKQGTVWVHIFGGAKRTPATKALVHVEKGDLVTATIEDGSVTVMGSPSSPAASEKQVGKVAEDTAEALQSADEARGAAQSAVASAAVAAQAADEAQDSAATAYKAANSALDQLGVVQDVVGVLNYVAEHGGFVLTQDQAIVDGKVYFTLDSQTGDYVPVVDPQASQLSSYYEVSEDYDDVMGDFIMAHLAVTSRGLWVLPSGIGSSTTPASGESQTDSDARQGADYKVLLSNDGMYVYDGDGVPVALYGATAIIGKSSGNHIAVGTGGVAVMDGTDEVAGFGSTVHIGKVANNSRYFSIDSNGNGTFHGAKLDIFDYPYDAGTELSKGTIRHHYVKVANNSNNQSLHAVSLYANASDAKVGLYDETNAKWILHSMFQDPNVDVLVTIPQSFAIGKRMYLPNGTQIWDNASQVTHLLTPVNSSNKQAEFTFEPDGKIYRRTSTNGGTSWSSWTSIAG